MEGKSQAMSDSITLADDELIEKWIEPDPWKMGAEEARIKTYGMNVWAVVGYLKMRDGNPADVAQGYEIPIEAVQAAMAHYRRHQHAIDCRLARNLAR
jgi:uncharacterized protein (DUF433 family)